MIKKIVKVLYNLFKKVDEPHAFDFEKNNYNRLSFINRAILNQDKVNCKYLEIGVFRNQVFNSIPIKKVNKIGVDPVMGGTHRMTSDDFFKANKKQFDVIFIDGLHHYKQVQKDLINSLNVLNQGGLILIHDMLPQNPGQEKVPQSQASWTGDVWKLAEELLESKIDFVIANIDHGVGIVKPRGKKNYKSKHEKLLNQRFDSFMEIKVKLPIVTCEEAFDFIDS